MQSKPFLYRGTEIPILQIHSIYRRETAPLAFNLVH